MQPLPINSTFSAACTIRRWSRPASPNSLTTTPVPWPSGVRRKRCTSVVLPLPRNPVTMKSGNRSVITASMDKRDIKWVDDASGQSLCRRPHIVQRGGELGAADLVKQHQRFPIPILAGHLYRCQHEIDKADAALAFATIVLDVVEGKALIAQASEIAPVLAGAEDRTDLTHR